MWPLAEALNSCTGNHGGLKNALHVHVKTYSTIGHDFFNKRTCQELGQALTHACYACTERCVP